MADETANPKRQRWRWVLAGIFFGAGAGGWWYWPRGDARFVGTWAGWKPGHQRPSVYFEFASNGVVTQRDSQHEFSRRVPWRAQNQTLTIGYEGALLGPLADTAGSAIFRMTGHWPVARAYTSKFHVVDHDTIQIWRGANDPMTLRRILE